MSDLGELIRKAIDVRLGALHVTVPAKVRSYDAATQRCSVVPQSHLRHGETELALPVLEDVPVCWPRAGGCTISLPLVVGDVVVAFFSDRMLDGFLGTGVLVEPTDPRAHALADAFVVPMGAWPDAQPSTAVSATDIVVTFDNVPGSSIRITPAGTIAIGGTGAQPVALAPLVTTNLQALLPALNAIAAALTAMAAADVALAALTTAPPAAATAVALETPFVVAAVSAVSALSAWPAPLAAALVSAK